MYSQNQTKNKEISKLPITVMEDSFNTEEIESSIDLGSMKCPMLGLKSMQALRNLKKGESIVIATDSAGARKAIGRVSWMTGTRLVTTLEKDGKFKHLLRRE